MSPKPLPESDHAVRYIRKRLLRRDGQGNVVGILPQAFEPREGEAYLSVTWLEYYHASYELGLSESAAAMRLDLTIKKNDGFSVGNVGKLKSVCSGSNTRVRVLHEPNLPNNPGHSALRGLQRASAVLREEIAGDVFIDTRLNSQI